MTPTFSILHATYGRPQKAVAAMRMWFERAARPEEVEYVFAVNEEDSLCENIVHDARIIAAKFGARAYMVVDFFPGSAPAWDAAARASTGKILIQASDDVEPPVHWDVALALAYTGDPNYAKSTPFFMYDKEPNVIAVADGFRKDDLMTIAICNRGRYEQCGEFLHSGYRSVWSDDDFTYRAYRDQRDGKCAVIDARPLTFLHRHHYHSPEIPWDQTYARGNSEEAYRIGAELFAKRNPEANRDGLRTWQ